MKQTIRHERDKLQTIKTTNTHKMHDNQTLILYSFSVFINSNFQGSKSKESKEGKMEIITINT